MSLTRRVMGQAGQEDVLFCEEPPHYIAMPEIALPFDIDMQRQFDLPFAADSN